MYYGPGDLRLVDAPVPVAGPGEILVKIKAALTCGTDFKAYRQGHPVLLARTPSPFGHEMAGVISEVGSDLTTLREGQRVVVLNSAPCDHCFFCERGTPELCDNLELLNGAYAEYIRVPAHITRHNVHPLPEGMSFSAAALAEPFACALHAVDKMRLREDLPFWWLRCRIESRGRYAPNPLRGDRALRRLSSSAKLCTASARASQSGSCAN